MPEGVKVAPLCNSKGLIIPLEIWSKCIFGQIATSFEFCLSRRFLTGGLMQILSDYGVPPVLQLYEAKIRK
ncbi:hypothetical protein MKW98_014559 [Papaver atlanticum]|uniref:Uncharacterized protein n=1 Tax=Papaver atlanticum TaxID=357466 RepID=A0AAD4SGB5_9MAGN|nr:hypothetical protein MKW98_014559 [Papaver atlanticum]